jgi:hypothetical protein
MVLASFPAGDTRSQRRADWIADEHRQLGLDVHVIYDRDTDDFQVVTSEPNA